MRTYGYRRPLIKGLLVFWLLTGITGTLRSQNIIVNTAPLEGLDLTPDNMWGFQIQSMEDQNTRCTVDGVIRYRNAPYFIKYSFEYTLTPGVNTFSKDRVHPQWNYSSSALRELFNYYSVLPQGTYEYCVTVTPRLSHAESPNAVLIDDCVYKQSKDLFSITLLEPEDDAKIYEYNPMLSWIATYPFVSELTYRVRVAEIKKGQNTENAITRNNPVYSESNIVPTSITYPVYAKPLVVQQPYAWTVDAYYKGILLGGAQPWKFTIIEDSILKYIPKDVSDIDIRKESGGTTAYALGVLKLKYVLEEKSRDVLTIVIKRDNGDIVKIKNAQLHAEYGDNRYILDLKDTEKFKHKAKYHLILTNSLGSQYTLNFIYINPEFLPNAN